MAPGVLPVNCSPRMFSIFSLTFISSSSSPWLLRRDGTHGTPAMSTRASTAWSTVATGTAGYPGEIALAVRYKRCFLHQCQIMYCKMLNLLVIIVMRKIWVAMFINSIFFFFKQNMKSFIFGVLWNFDFGVTFCILAGLLRFIQHYYKWCISALQIIMGNVNTYDSVVRDLHPPIITRFLRLIPVTDAVHTVCMRVELFGCLWQGKSFYRYNNVVQKSPAYARVVARVLLCSYQSICVLMLQCY